MLLFEMNENLTVFILVNCLHLCLEQENTCLHVNYLNSIECI